MKHYTAGSALPLTPLAIAITTSLLVSQANADTVTDWNKYTILATKGATSLTTGVASIAQN